MGYLLTQIALCLAVATGIGALTAWLATRIGARERERSLMRRVEEFDEEVDRLHAALDERRAAVEEAVRAGDRARIEREEHERDLTVIIGERDRALTRAVGLQEEVEALAEAFRERNEQLQELQTQLEAATTGSANDAEREILRLRAELDRLKRLLDG